MGAFAADEDYQSYDDDDNKSEPNNIKEDNNVNRVSTAVLTKHKVEKTAKIGENVTLICDTEGLIRKLILHPVSYIISIFWKLNSKLLTR